MSRPAAFTVRGPDLSFVAAARLLAARVPASFVPLAPDLAVEIRSPDDRPAAVAEKVANYLDAGTRWSGSSIRLAAR